MKDFLILFSSEDWTRVVFVLLHSLWQGVGVSLALWFLLRRIPAKKPKTRYAASLLALAVMVLSTFVTWSVMDTKASLLAKAANREATAGMVAPSPASDRSRDFSTAPGRIPLAANPSPVVNAAIHNATTASAAQHTWIPWAILVWLAGCGVMSARLLTQWLVLGRLAGRCQAVTGELVDDLLPRLRKRLGIMRPILVLTADHIAGPSIYGFLTPKLLLPPALLLGVPRQQLEAIIAHELGHIRRHDYLVNLLQQLVEAVLFFNPAIWWINRQIRVEREACCDRLAVEITGDTRAYAWSLAQWTEKQAGYVLAPAFGSERQSGGPLERLKRLLVSEYRPPLRLPWPSFFGLLTVTGIVFLGLFQGTHVAVGLAAQLLSPSERISKIADIQDKYDSAANRKNASESTNQVIVRGTVQVKDASLQDVMVMIHTTRGNASTGYSMNPQDKDGHFEHSVRAGKIYLAAYCDGLAPAFAGPFEARVPEPLEGIDLTLTTGISAQIKTVAPDGKGIPDVEFDYIYEHPTGHTIQTTQKTGPDGLATFEHIASYPVVFRATVPDFQYDEMKFTPQPGQPTIWRLKPAKITHGTVIARSTGKPVSDARVVMISRDGVFKMVWGQFEHCPEMAVTGERGQFQLRNLNNEAAYNLAVLASGFAPGLLTNVVAGAELRVELNPQIDIKGRVVGNLATLGGENPQIKISQILQTGKSSTYTWSLSYPIEVRGDTGYFDMFDLIPGRVILTAGTWNKTLELTRSIDDLVVDLNDRSKDPNNLPPVAQREVWLRVKAPPGNPLPSGRFPYNYWSDVDHTGHSGEAEFTNGLAMVKIPVPGGVSMESTALKGYWIEMLRQSISPGPGPVDLTLEAIPAGTIYGEVVESDGSEASEVMIAVLEAEKSPLKKYPYGTLPQPKSSSSPDDGPTRFSAQPLPLGGKYMILAYRRQTYAASDVISINDKNPMQKITLKLAAGLKVKGRVLDGQGRPKPRVPVAMEFNAKYSHSFGSEPILTDADGGFQFERVNPAAPGSYLVIVRPGPGFQPASQTLRFNQSPIVFTLSPGVSVTGIVLDRATGKPIPGAKVRAFLDNEPQGIQYNWEAEAGPDGRFVLDGLGRKSYRLSVIGAEMDPIIVRGGQSGNVTLRAKPYPRN